MLWFGTGLSNKPALMSCASDDGPQLISSAFTIRVAAEQGADVVAPLGLWLMPPFGGGRVLFAERKGAVISQEVDIEIILADRRQREALFAPRQIDLAEIDRARRWGQRHS